MLVVSSETMDLARLAPRTATAMDGQPAILLVNASAMLATQLPLVIPTPLAFLENARGVPPIPSVLARCATSGLQTPTLMPAALPKELATLLAAYPTFRDHVRTLISRLRHAISTDNA